MTKKSKLVLVFFLMITLIGLTGLSFAYWDQLVANDKNNEVTIGEGQSVTVSETTKGSGTLVPAGVVTATGDVEFVEFKYNVTISKTPIAALSLEVKVGNIRVGATEQTATVYDNKEGLIIFKIEYTNGSLLVDDTTPVEVVVTVTLITDGENVDYSAIQGQNIYFDLTFEANK